MTLGDIVDHMLEQEGSLGDRTEATSRIRSVMVSATTRMLEQLVAWSPGLSFEIEVDAEYDSGSQTFDAEVVVALHHPGDTPSTEAAMALIRSGFMYYAATGLYRAEMTIGQRT